MISSSQISSGSGIVDIFTNKTSLLIKDDGSVITWEVVLITYDGDYYTPYKNQFGVDAGEVASNLSSGVINIFSTAGSFAALKDDGSVVTWGDGLHYDSSSQISSGSGIVDIFTNKTSFAGLKDDGSVITWGGSTYHPYDGDYFAPYKNQFGVDAGEVASNLSSGVIIFYGRILLH